MIIVLGSARVRPEERDRLLGAVRDVVTATEHDEGCVSYQFAADVRDPDVIVSVEVWRDQAALDAHMEHAHTRTFIAAVSPLLDGEPTMQFHHTIQLHPTTEAPT